MAKKSKASNTIVKTVIDMTLDRPAKKVGGDRYTDGQNITVYIPQTISRKEGSPAPNLTMTIAKAKMKDAEEFTLDRPAKKEGGDRYTNGSETHYLPQKVTRKDGVPAPALYIQIG